jgi:hypothetical protein
MRARNPGQMFRFGISKGRAAFFRRPKDTLILGEARGAAACSFAITLVDDNWFLIAF